MRVQDLRHAGGFPGQPDQAVGVVAFVHDHAPALAHGVDGVAVGLRSDQHLSDLQDAHGRLPRGSETEGAVRPVPSGAALVDAALPEAVLPDADLPAGDRQRSALLGAVLPEADLRAGDRQGPALLGVVLPAADRRGPGLLGASPGSGPLPPVGENDPNEEPAGGPSCAGLPGRRPPSGVFRRPPPQTSSTSP